MTLHAKMTVAEFEDLASQGVPYVGQLGCKVRRFERGEVDILMPWQELILRPGGTVCGPAMFALADITLYGVVLSLVGRVELAVTTDLTMHFLKRPAPGDILGKGRLLRIGTRLAVGQVTLHSDIGGDMLAHGVGTYALPGPAK